jgi:hypothetical protein
MHRTESEETLETSSPSPATGEIVAKAATYFRNTRYSMVLMFIGMGAWFCYDGWVKYPAANEEAIKTTPHVRPPDVDDAAFRELVRTGREDLLQADLPRSQTDIQLQKLLGAALPPIGLLLLGWALYQSRGEYRLSGRTLHVPGHPPVPMDSIVRIDEKLWDRKGIAYIDYELADGKKGRFKLDDFIYERQPIDDIFKRIKDDIVGAPNPDASAEGTAQA